MANYFLDKNCVVIGCSRSEPVISHPNYFHKTTDIAKESELQEFIALVKSHGVDVLINNAAQASMNAFITTPDDTFRRLLEVNSIAPFALMREMAKLMSRKGGNIINISSVANSLDMEFEAAYAASKAAVESLTRIGAREWAGMGIRVNALAPGPVATDLLKNVPKERIDYVLQKQAIPELTKASAIAHAIDFFISPESEGITGQVLAFGGVRP